MNARRVICWIYRSLKLYWFFETFNTDNSRFLIFLFSVLRRKNLMDFFLALGKMLFCLWLSSVTLDRLTTLWIDLIELSIFLFLRFDHSFDIEALKCCIHTKAALGTFFRSCLLFISWSKISKLFINIETIKFIFYLVYVFKPLNFIEPTRHIALLFHPWRRFTIKLLPRFLVKLWWLKFFRRTHNFDLLKALYDIVAVIIIHIYNIYMIYCLMLAVIF